MRGFFWKEEHIYGVKEGELLQQLNVSLFPFERSFSPASSSMDGFYVGGIVDSCVEYTRAMEMFHADVEGMNDSLSRVKYRMIMTGEFVLKESFRFQRYLEAIAELDDNLFLVSVAKNAWHRKSDPQDRARILGNLAEARSLPRRHGYEFIHPVLDQGYELKKLLLDDHSPVSADVLDQLTTVCENFHWTREETLEQITAPENQVYVATLDTKIVSTGMAITYDYMIGTDAFRFVEVSWAATLPEHAGKGLYGAVSAAITIDQQERNVDLLYGECNGLSQVLRIVSRQGRTDAVQTGEQFGLHNTGILEQDVQISGSDQRTIHTDLVFMSMPRSKHAEFY